MVFSIILRCSTRTNSFTLFKQQSSLSLPLSYRFSKSTSIGSTGSSSSSSSSSSRWSTTTSKLKSTNSNSSNSNTNTNFISVNEAISKFNDPTTIYIDGSWHLSKDRNAKTEYENGPRIQNAHFFDIDDVATNDIVLNPKQLPHMMPQLSLFNQIMDTFHNNINHLTTTSTIIIYASKDCAFASRAYYTFKTLCLDSNNVFLMQGSLQEWMDAGGPTETDFKSSIAVSELSSSSSSSSSTDDNDSSNDGYIGLEDQNSVTMDQMLNEFSDDNTTSQSIIVDARGGARFRKEVPEPRPGLRGGHMPGALNVPFTQLLQDDDMTKYKSVNEMKDIFDKAGVDIMSENKMILTCGSGVTACVLAVAMSECGRDLKNTFIYDGSWLEWGSDPDTPIV